MQGFDYWQLLYKFRYPLLILLSGLILLTAGVFVFKSGILEPSTKVEVLDNTTEKTTGDITSEISGAIENPGVYKLQNGSRIEDLIVAAGGFSKEADRTWTDKYLNRASKLVDGQKVYISSVDQQSNVLSAKATAGDQTISSQNSSDSYKLININTASLGELDTLPGIGQVYGQNIIEHRPYSDTSELLSKGILKQSVYDKVKDRISVY